MKLFIIIIAFMGMSCGSRQHSAQAIEVINQLVKASCVTIAHCMPARARESVNPEAFCAALEAAGTIAEFIATQAEGDSCPVE